ncbi:hypothetical protein U1Q18_018848 [Sarracenia purpurea var. burkii]
MKGVWIVGVPEATEEEASLKKKKKGGLKLKIKIGNPSLRRLISGAVAGAVSRTAVASLEKIRICEQRPGKFKGILGN